MEKVNGACPGRLPAQRKQRPGTHAPAQQPSTLSTPRRQVTPLRAASHPQQQQLSRRMPHAEPPLTRLLLTKESHCLRVSSSQLAGSNTSLLPTPSSSPSSAPELPTSSALASADSPRRNGFSAAAAPSAAAAAGCCCWLAAAPAPAPAATAGAPLLPLPPLLLPMRLTAVKTLLSTPSKSSAATRARWKRCRWRSYCLPARARCSASLQAGTRADHGRGPMCVGDKVGQWPGHPATCHTAAATSTETAAADAGAGGEPHLISCWGSRARACLRSVRR